MNDAAQKNQEKNETGEDNGEAMFFHISGFFLRFKTPEALSGFELAVNSPKGCSKPFLSLDAPNHAC